MIEPFVRQQIDSSSNDDEQQHNDDHYNYYETPYQAARRELIEETNVFTELENGVLEEQGGPYLGVPYISPSRRSGTQQTQTQKRIIRVYPFAVHISDDDANRFERRGTEHDDHKFVAFEELSNMESQYVPGLLQAFHHATYGTFHREISDNVRCSSNDKENAASIMTQTANKLVTSNNNNNDNNDECRATTRTTKARHIAMLRPSIVPIVNVMNRIIAEIGKESAVVAMESLFLHEMDRCVEMGQMPSKIY